MRLIHPADGVLLTEDAVYLTQSSTLLQRLTEKTKHIYALSPDIEARGLKTKSLIKNVTYSDMVELCVTHSKVISW
jgi:sulfur relay protein TusB/DsrH